MKKSADFLLEAKRDSRKIACLTAYDYPTARLLDGEDLDILLVGDSLGMVVLGHPDTTSVRMDDMLHHTRAVARGVAQAWIVSDLPAGSCPSPEAAAENSARLIEAGADAVKIEGGRECLRMIEAIRGAGIQVVGHLGMLPQRVVEEGGYRIKGRSDSEAERMMDDAKALENAGVAAIVLELVYPPVTEQLTSMLRIPTIGIGSGPACDGQILVIHDVIGLFPWFRPKFATARADVAGEIRRAAAEFVQATRSGGKGKPL
ncbi:MAG: 3-methyl-2-oxobutanoate hydroxymethyltransferase [Verrucomicrobiaceae bacterium]|nr:MAG: 3-methyl-2-oxobutanoate hydroxymethyltransferase [Verrucomicrobiaceae bacterium]